MSERPSRWRAGVLLAVSIGLVIVGLLSVAVYAVNFVAVLDQPDQSLMFWFLPFLLYGLAAAGVGTVLFVLWLLLVHVDRNGDREAYGRDGD